MLDEEGDMVEEGRFRTIATSVVKHFQDVPAARIAIEAGTHSIWISEQLARYGHEVIVRRHRTSRDRAQYSEKRSG